MAPDLSKEYLGKMKGAGLSSFLADEFISFWTQLEHIVCSYLEVTMEFLGIQ